MKILKIQGHDLAEVEKAAATLVHNDPKVMKQLKTLDQPLSATLSGDGNTLTVDSPNADHAQIIMVKGS
jgi:hypothetical protein